MVLLHLELLWKDGLCWQCNENCLSLWRHRGNPCFAGEYVLVPSSLSVIVTGLVLGGELSFTLSRNRTTFYQNHLTKQSDLLKMTDTSSWDLGRMKAGSKAVILLPPVPATKIPSSPTGLDFLSKERFCDCSPRHKAIDVIHDCRDDSLDSGGQSNIREIFSQETYFALIALTLKTFPHLLSGSCGKKKN